MSKPSKHADLDLFARMLKVFADTPWLHYGLWLQGETPSFPKVRQAQERYVDKLLALLPPAPASILDIGGGTGAMSERLVSLGYTVEMLTPSEYAGRHRAPDAWRSCEGAPVRGSRTSRPGDASRSACSPRATSISRSRHPSPSSNNCWNRVAGW